MKFNSQVCTTREQSERLLSLGLKKETADMVYHSYGYIIDEFGNKERRFKQPTIRNLQDYEGKYAIPAWSLHRLIEMIQKVFVRVNLCGWWVHIGRKVHNKEYFADVHYNLFDNIIDCIEWLIKEGYFNKEYLVGKK